jgi:hypothetical protein
MEELGKGVSTSPEPGFECGGSCWRVLDENYVIEIPKLGFGIVKENKIMMPHPLKEHLGFGCVTNWYQSMVTILGVLGIMEESRKNHI